MAGLGNLIIPAVKGRMGDRNYYAAVMRMQDVAARVGQAVEMEQPSQKLQRPKADKRVKEIVEYLSSDDRFFNSLVVAMYGAANWRHFDDFSVPDFKGYAEFIGFLELSGSEKMYALDGQHRLFGIQTFLQAPAKSREAMAKIRELADESVGVVFVEHYENQQDRLRSRRLFTVLNKKVVKVSKRDIIYLDEDSAMAITTRALIEDDDGIFSLKRERVYDGPGNTLPRSEERTRLCFTSVGTLYDCFCELFTKAFRRGMKKSALESERLLDSDLDVLREQTKEFFTMLEKYIPEVGMLFRASTDQDIASVVSCQRNQTDGGHLLFRPMGLKVFVEVVCSLYEQGKTKEMAYSSEEMRQAIEKAAQLPLGLNEEPAKGVVWNTAKHTIETKHFRLLGKVYRHMLGIGKEGELLAKQYQNALGDPSAKLPQLKG